MEKLNWEPIRIRCTGSGAKSKRGIGKFSVICANHESRKLWFTDSLSDAIRISETHIKEEHPS